MSILYQVSAKPDGRLENKMEMLLRTLIASIGYMTVCSYPVVSIYNNLYKARSIEAYSYACECTSDHILCQ